MSERSGWSVRWCACMCVSVLCPTSCHVNGTEFPQQEKPSSLSSSTAPHNSMSTQAAFKSPSTSVCDNKTEESLESKHSSYQGQMCLLHLTLKCHNGPFLISDSWSQFLTSESVSSSATSSAMQSNGCTDTFCKPFHASLLVQKRDKAKSVSLLDVKICHTRGLLKSEWTLGGPALHSFKEILEEILGNSLFKRVFDVSYSPIIASHQHIYYHIAFTEVLFLQPARFQQPLLALRSVKLLKSGVCLSWCGTRLGHSSFLREAHLQNDAHIH